jgi:competence protein CoiA
MQYAMVEGHRREAFRGGRGTCPTCGADALAKCGTRKIPHWAHQALKDCDPWWENETDWHRTWKNHYPEECREVVHVASDGEIHRSDIKTPHGIYIEVQHSHLPEPERLAREAFYGNLIWVLDGRSFRKNFDIYHPLPHPRSLLAGDLVWSKATRGMKGANVGLFLRLSENKSATKATLRWGQIHPLEEIQAEVKQNYVGHHQFDWIRPHQSWLAAACPVYIDFGETHLVRLQTYDESGLRCVRMVRRDDFLQATLTANRAADVVPD